MRLTLTILSAFLLMNSAFAETADEWIKRIDNKVQNYSVKGVSFNMVVVVPNWFYFGDEESTISIGHMGVFMIGQTEVTQELFQVVMGYNPSIHRGPQLPVENVSWNECQMFILKLNMMTGLEFCLPTEAEWEFAARGGNKKCHNDQSGGAVFNTKQTMDVASMYPNCLGIYDMSGNVDEWCLDDDVHYTFDSQVNPLMVTSKKWPGCRGGSYYSQYHYLTQKYGMDPNWENDQTGFRLAMSRDGNQ